MRYLLFLDIDGVARPDILPNDYALKESLVSNINLLVERYNMEIVISSNWREIFPLSYFNSVFNSKVIGFTDVSKCNSGFPRHLEIQRFLNKINEPYEYLVIDDKRDLFPVNFTKLHLCDRNLGFDYESYYELIQRLDLGWKRMR